MKNGNRNFSGIPKNRKAFSIFFYKNIERRCARPSVHTDLIYYDNLFHHPLSSQRLDYVINTASNKEMNNEDCLHYELRITQSRHEATVTVRNRIKPHSC